MLAKELATGKECASNEHSIILNDIHTYMIIIKGTKLMSICFPVKIIEKNHIRKENKAHYVIREKDILSSIDHPFFVKLFFTFQDSHKLCILFRVKLWCWAVKLWNEIKCVFVKLIITLLKCSKLLIHQILPSVMQRMENYLDTFAK